LPIGRHVSGLASRGTGYERRLREKRWRGIGTIRGRTTVVIFAEPFPERVRVISLRRAHHEEREEQEKAIQNGLEAH
jgi:uncharacterized DUF497 family protein